MEAERLKHYTALYRTIHNVLLLLELNHVL